MARSCANSQPLECHSLTVSPNNKVADLSTTPLPCQESAQATKMLWLVSTRYYGPQRWEAYNRLFETMAQLEPGTGNPFLSKTM